MVVTPEGRSFPNKLLSRKDISITITSSVRYVKCTISLGLKCTMSRQEIAKAVEQIQEAPPTNELAELQAFIEAQNCSVTTGKDRTILITYKNTVDKITIMLIATVREPTYNTHKSKLIGQAMVNEPSNTEASSATMVENPGYTTQSNMVLHEPVQFHYIYDPINDIMKRVEKVDANATKDVGKGKPNEETSTGKSKTASKNFNFKASNTLGSCSNEVHFHYLTGTESDVAQLSRPVRQGADKHGVVSATKPATERQTNPARSTTPTSASSDTVHKNTQDMSSDPGPSSASNTVLSACASATDAIESDGNTDMDAQLSCSFSSEEEIPNVNEKTASGNTKEFLKERHAQIDSRIVSQKASHWKGKEGLKCNSDPRQAAIIPKMERMNLAKMKALEQRAKSKSTPIEGDIVTIPLRSTIALYQWGLVSVPKVRWLKRLQETDQIR